MTVLSLCGKLMLFILVGFFARKTGVIADGYDQMLSRFLMAIPLPCMIITSFQIEYSPEDLATFPMLLLASIILVFLNFLLAQLIYVFIMKRSAIGRAVRFGLIFTNFTFFGLAVVNEVCGAHGVFYYVIFTLPIRIIFYSSAPLLLSDHSLHLERSSFVRTVISPPVISVFIGFMLYVLRLSLPGIVNDTIKTLGNMASPIGLMLCGSIIADANWAGIKNYPCVVWVVLLRLVVIPGLVLLCFSLLDVKDELSDTLIYYFAMPVASLLPTFCLRYNPDEPEARIAGSYMVVVSTLLSILTIPLWSIIKDIL